MKRLWLQFGAFAIVVGFIASIITIFGFGQSLLIQPIELENSFNLNTVEELGGINQNSFCQSMGDSGAILDGSTAYDWHCVTSTGKHIPFSETAACQWQYHDSHALDRLANYFNPNSWQCFTNATELSGANPNSFCQSMGDSGAILDGNTAYDWHCVTSTGEHIPFSETTACQWQYHDSHALDRLADYFNPNSWQCLI